MTVKGAIGYLLYIAAVVALVLAIVSAFDNDKSPSKRPVTEPPQVSIGAPASPPAAPAKPKPPEPKPPASNRSSTSKAAPGTTKPPTAGTQLLNTGPGDILGLLAMSFIGGSLSYHFYLRRQSR
jgi:hypothetical protein